MKKTIVILFLVVLVFALLCGCTSPEKDTEAAQPGTPDPQTGHIESQDTMSNEQGSPVNTLENGTAPEGSSNQISDSGSAFEDEPDLETASDYVVDGGDGGGFGGN